MCNNINFCNKSHLPHINTKYYHGDHNVSFNKKIPFSGHFFDFVIDLMKTRRLHECNSDPHGTYSHISSIFMHYSTTLQVLSTGMNTYRASGKEHIPSIHAEGSAINHLLRRKTKKTICVDIIVLRVSPTMKLGNSRPCFKCVQDMNSVPTKKGYKIKNVYYSNQNGDIVCRKLTSLLNDEYQHVSKFYKNRNYNSTLSFRRLRNENIETINKINDIILVIKIKYKI
jgi:cytidine deaminase